MVLALGQGQSDAHPCILQICTVASLSTPLRGSRNVFAIKLRPHGVSVKSNHKVFTKPVLSQNGYGVLLFVVCWLLKG